MTGIAIDANTWPSNLCGIVFNCGQKGRTTCGRGTVLVEHTNRQVTVGEWRRSDSVAMNAVNHALELVRLIERKTIGHDG